jgi:hypothetical protein
VLGKAVHQVEVEITQEVWVVLLDHSHHPQCTMVERLDGGRHWLSSRNVVLEESENLDD